jgi:hypothetical protein
MTSQCDITAVSCCHSAALKRNMHTAVNSGACGCDAGARLCTQSDSPICTHCNRQVNQLDGFLVLQAGEEPYPYPSVHAPWYGYLFWTIATAGGYGKAVDTSFVAANVERWDKCAANIKVGWLAMGLCHVCPGALQRHAATAAAATAARCQVQCRQVQALNLLLNDSK